MTRPLSLRTDDVLYCLAEVRRGIYGPDGLYFAILEFSVEAYQELPIDDPRQRIVDDYVCMPDIIFDRASNYVNERGWAALRRIKAIDLGRRAVAAARSARRLGLEEVELSAVETIECVFGNHLNPDQSPEPITQDELGLLPNEYDGYRKPLVIITGLMTSRDTLWQQHLNYLSDPNPYIAAASAN